MSADDASQTMRTVSDWYTIGVSEAQTAMDDGSIDSEEYGGRTSFPDDVLRNWSDELQLLPPRKQRKATRALLAGLFNALEGNA